MQNLSEQEWLMGYTADENAVIIDVRTPQEWNEGVIENAMLLNIFEAETFMEKVATLDKSKNYYVYCRSGARSGQACQILNNNGIKKVHNLMGGIMSWTGAVVVPSN